MRLVGVFFLATLCRVLIGQSVTEDFKRQQESERLELIRKREAMMRSFEADPEKYRDSISVMRAKAQREEAQKRIARYEQNNRKDTIRVLDLSYAGFSQLPDIVFDFDSIQKLILDYNAIGKLPRKLRKLEHLVDLRWNNSENNGKLKISRGLRLSRLEATSSGLKKIPPIRKLKDLEYVDFSNNFLTDLPLKQLSSSSKLKEVVLKQNSFGSIEEMRFEKWKGVEILKLNKCEISSIDPSFYLIPNLKELQLQENPLSSIPDGISSLRELGKISFYKCDLETLPNDFFGVPNLVIADLYYNQLKRIPSSIGNARNIEVLFLSHNQIIEVPEEIGELSKLQQLYLHNNKITFLPQSLINLAELRVLRVNNNLLQQFPIQIVNLSGLTDLDIDDNMIEFVPETIGQLSNLKLFTFDGNPINFNDPRNKSFMEQVSKLEKSGTICKPSIQMNYVDQNEAKVDM